MSTWSVDSSGSKAGICAVSVAEVSCAVWRPEGTETSPVMPCKDRLTAVCADPLTHDLHHLLAAILG